ncbi:MAG: UDP-N-acetylmuramoyl-tripeptide--D-alanyl-D-alanine ligase [Spirochaetes bacterium]|nr:UDP-N-acetylmuramoyl-tripeptide--D-alanyl-D-alanine ligase [Spirochaetota bacterium]
MIVSCATTAGRIAEAARGRLTSGDPSTAIETISTDSREIGAKGLFIPLVGEKFDGHDYIRPLSENRSISSYLTMKEGFTDIASSRGIAEIRCEDTLRALGSIGARHRDEIDPIVIGITGTNGKTTTKELVYAILSARKSCLKNVKNYNNEIGVPMTLLGLAPGHEMAVIEMGMNHPGELDRLSNIARPDLALITNVGEGHLEFLGSVENVASAKSEIMHGMRPGSTLLVNRDMDCLDIVMAGARKSDLVVKSFGLSDRADIRPDSYRLYHDSLTVLFRGVEISVPLYGIHNVYNVMAAVAVAAQYGIGPEAVRDSLAGFVNVDGRSQIIDRGFLVINDSYNANPLSLRYALRSTAEIFPERRKIAVLSDMKELGEASRRCHTECGAAVKENKFDMLLVWGDMAGCYAEGARQAGFDPDRIQRFETKDELSRYVRTIADENDVILVKGSRSMKMEDVVSALAGREE